MDYFLKSSALHQLKKLPSKIQQYILQKLDFYTSKPSPLHFADKLTNHHIGDWRFRVGDYRIIFDVSQGKIIVLKVGHRKDVYK